MKPTGESLVFTSSMSESMSSALIPGTSPGTTSVKSDLIPLKTSELIGSSFKITNPQASSSCGCGTSFSI